MKGCFARETFKEVMNTALDACKRLYEYFNDVIGDEVRRIHSEKTTTIDTGDLELEKLQIYEAGDEPKLESEQYEEYDLAFEQLISDSEKEDDDEN